MNFQDTICATATAPGTGALGIIRVSGNESLSIVNKIFKGKNLEKSASHTVHYGFISSPQPPPKEGETAPANDGASNLQPSLAVGLPKAMPPTFARRRLPEGDASHLIDEVMVSVFKAPKTFTAENLVEISCHGSPYIQQRIIELLLKNGCRLATPGEFTQRAFLNGRIDLTQAEAVADLIAAENKASHEIALNQMRGGISSDLQNLREQLVNFTALIELELDFSEEDVEFADRTEFKELIQNLKFKIQNLIKTFEYGNAIKNGVPVAIIGKPNAGKSTLLNALLNEERAIVSDIAGTTRDTIEEAVTLDGITFRFIDTAGIRDTQDTIEAIGVERAKEKVSQAKVVIHLYEEDTEILDDLKDVLQDKIVFNLQSKADKHLQTADAQQLLEEKYPGYLHFPISVKTGLNMALLTQKLVAQFKNETSAEAVIITNARHKEALENTLTALLETEQGMHAGLSGDLLAIHLKDALYHLGSITGQIDVDKDILGTIFGKFCIGK